MEQLATYLESRPEGTRIFELFDKKILVRARGSFMQPVGEAAIALDILNPEPDKSWVRSRFCFWGFLMILFGFCGLGIVSILKLPIELFLEMIVVPCIVIGAVISLFTIRKVEFALFKNDSGIYILTIARSGKCATQFTSFVERISNQIKAVRQNNVS